MAVLIELEAEPAGAPGAVTRWHWLVRDDLEAEGRTGQVLTGASCWNVGAWEALANAARAAELLEAELGA